MIRRAQASILVVAMMLLAGCGSATQTIAESGATRGGAASTSSGATVVPSPSGSIVPATGELDQLGPGMPTPHVEAGPCPSGQVLTTSSVALSRATAGHGDPTPAAAVRRLGYTGALRIDGSTVTELRHNLPVATFRVIVLTDGTYAVDQITMQSVCSPA